MIDDKFPQTWTHKKNGKKVRAMPWWEIVDSEITEKNIPMPKVNVRWKFGMLVQIGWLLENENGVWLGVGPKAEEEFDK